MENQKNTKMIIASRLSIARKQAGLSQAQAAEKMSLPRPSISEIEAGRRNVTAEELALFADLYAVDLNWLIGKNEEIADPIRDRLELAARGVSGLNNGDLEKVIELLKSLKKQEG